MPEGFLEFTSNGSDINTFFLFWGLGLGFGLTLVFFLAISAFNSLLLLGTLAGVFWIFSVSVQRCVMKPRSWIFWVIGIGVVVILIQARLPYDLPNRTNIGFEKDCSEEDREELVEVLSKFKWETDNFLIVKRIRGKPDAEKWGITEDKVSRLESLVFWGWPTDGKWYVSK